MTLKSAIPGRMYTADAVSCDKSAIGARLASAVFLRPAAPPSDERCVSASCPGTLPRPQGAGAGLRKSAEGGRKR